MANLFNAYIYGIDAAGGSTEIAAAGGQLNAFAPSTCHVYPAPASTVRGVAQVTCVSIIEVFPTGANHVPSKYYTAATVATLTTAANAALS